MQFSHNVSTELLLQYQSIRVHGEHKSCACWKHNMHISTVGKQKHTRNLIGTGDSLNSADVTSDINDC